MKSIAEKGTIITATSLFESKDRFCFSTYTRSAIIAAAGEMKGDKKPPKSFVRSIIAGLSLDDDKFYRAIPLELSDLVEARIPNTKNKTFYDANYLEHYINNGFDIYKIFMNRYFKYEKAVVVSFQNKSLISRNFGSESAYIQIPYNDFYDKVDIVTAQVMEFSDEYPLCVLDCPMFSSAIAPKLWEKTNMSIIDLGKSLTLARSFFKTK